MFSINVELVDSSVVIPLEDRSASTFQVFSDGIPVSREVKTNASKELQMALCGLDVVKTFDEQEKCLQNLENLELKAGDKKYPLNIVKKS